MKALHPKQIKLLEILKNNISDPLTMEELADRLDVCGKSVVFHHIKQLEKKGYLKRNPANPRDYIILKDPERNVIYLKMYGMPAWCISPPAKGLWWKRKGTLWNISFPPKTG